jgi:hypothetical protein
VCRSSHPGDVAEIRFDPIVLIDMIPLDQPPDYFGSFQMATSPQLRPVRPQLKFQGSNATTAPSSPSCAVLPLQLSQLHDCLSCQAMTISTHSHARSNFLFLPTTSILRRTSIFSGLLSFTFPPFLFYTCQSSRITLTVHLINNLPRITFLSFGYFLFLGP